jgi:hypothetical protein
LESAAPFQPPSINIPSYSHSARRPANIPLHNLSTSSRPRDENIAYLLEDRSSFDTPSEESDFSWSDTGDLVDQLADQEDPLAIALEGARPKHHSTSGRKRVRYQDESSEKPERGAIRKEDIEIPEPGPRNIPKAEQIIARLIMAPRDGPSRIHGLHGKKLVFVLDPVLILFKLTLLNSYFTSVFVSLGVFLFGYDQGVMSGIITCAVLNSYHLEYI